MLLFVQIQGQIFSQVDKEAPLPLTTKVELKSDYGQEYNIYLSLPAEYKDSKDSFPVVYIMDADLNLVLPITLEF